MDVGLSQPTVLLQNIVPQLEHGRLAGSLEFLYAPDQQAAEGH